MRGKRLALWHNVSGASSAEYALLLSIMGTVLAISAIGLAFAISNSLESAAALFPIQRAANDGSGTAGSPGSSGNSTNAPGQTGSTPGQSGNTPANGNSPPGQSGSTPTPPGSPGGGTKK